jgi:hypothetical protein
MRDLSQGFLPEALFDLPEVGRLCGKEWALRALLVTIDPAKLLDLVT